RAASCRKWLESTLLSLERRRVLEVTRERRPPHYHVALFSAAYLSYVEGLTGETKEALLGSPPGRTTAESDVIRTAASASARTVAPAPDPEPSTYVVRRGDTLWRIARPHDTTPTALRRANPPPPPPIRPGQRRSD